MSISPTGINNQPPKITNTTVPSKSRKKKSRKKKSGRFAGVVKVNETYHKPPNRRQGISMSTWAENFTVAATWQLKHQVAYWKARAVALEYENKVLHDMIRENHLVQPEKTKPSMDLGSQGNSVISEPEIDNEEAEEQEDDDDDELEVSEEFIQFLMENAKFKEDARRERELLKAKQQAEFEAQVNLAFCHESAEENEAKLTEMYGDKWQKILALEMSTMCDYMNEVDQEKPMFWPNIPFNFNSS